MKKLIISLISINLIIIAIAFTITPVIGRGDVNAPIECKWHRKICPWWQGGGTYEACLISGNGFSCTCGLVTRLCGKATD